MKNLLLQYKPFLLFLGKFLLTYIVLTLVYQSYLNRFEVEKNEVDSFSQLVANQTQSVLTLFDAKAHIEAHPTEPSIKIFYKDQYISRIIEGCNALSVIILFVSFIVAFTGKFKQTLIFILLGSVLIHFLNIARIALLCIALYSFPEYEHMLHGVVFPLVIYGIVFLLWVIWVNKFSLHATTTAKK
ncbi:exosortase family protein XrtF [Flavobacterium sp. IMCC34852]|uniref:Exosortase family protein XrtF n=1 Tax=Flavobacterium rivulicola TaxID=2732161 RepID=A0A7Y3R8T1_9FLAO|nr:exosortase family protein XrtF [Flavobacterium sp. IMCC34852]NNT71936.1 exosortase family protein XrtF [Flavobacterium sp. IMCC34852]